MESAPAAAFMERERLTAEAAAEEYMAELRRLYPSRWLYELALGIWVYPKFGSGNLGTKYFTFSKSTPKI